MERLVDATTPLGDALWFREMTGIESISNLFEFDVTFHSKTQGLSAKAMLGKPVTLKVETEDGAGVRHFNGICTRFSSGGREGEFHLYTAKLRPWLWVASRRSDCKIFQKMKVPDIIKDVLGKYPYPFKDKLTGSYREWDYCVQYQETDLNFVMRLMEHEGIYFYFEHDDGVHTLVFADSISSHSPLPGKSTIKYYGIDATTVADEEHFNSWSVREEVDPGKYYAIDYDFEKPKADLLVNQNKQMGHENDKWDQFEWPGGYVEHGDGENYAHVRMEMLTAEQERTTGTCTVRTMAPGYRFTLERCPRADQNREYLVVGSTYYFRDNIRKSSWQGADDAIWEIKASSHPTSIPYRAQLLTPKPRTTGPQTALVVGPPGEEIYTDKYGRIKVQFYWDRYGKKNENSSCWIRVASQWAGEKWGFIHIPRIGQEVVVDFLGGDPDYPLITGCVYNADQMPPYALPANKTASGIKSRSTKGGSATDFNEIRMEDLKGKEQLYVHAQRNLDTVVEADESRMVGHDRNTRINHNDSRFVVNDDSHVIKGNQRVQIQGTQDVTVTGNQNNTTKANQSNMVMGGKVQSVKGNLKEKVGGDHRESVGGKHTFNVSGDEGIQIGGKQSSFVQSSRKSVIVGKETVTSIGKTSHFAAAGYNILTPLQLSTQSLTRKAKVYATDEETIIGMQTNKVGGMRNTTVGGVDNLSITGAQTTTVGGVSTLSVTGAITQSAGAAVSISAVGAVAVTGGAAVTVTGATATITAATINLVGIVNVVGMVNVLGPVTALSIVSPTYTPGLGNFI
jgi:type VI secretion system secreted protein VgrG